MKMTDQTDHNTGGSNLDKLREIEELCENIRVDISYLNQLESGLTLAASRGADVGAATIGLQEQRASLEQRMNAAQAALDHAFDTEVGELRSVANEVRAVREAPADYASNPTGAASPDWTLQDWIGLVGAASKINLGFQDATPYQDASAWAQPSPELAFPFSLPEGAPPGSVQKPSPIKSSPS